MGLCSVLWKFRFYTTLRIIMNYDYSYGDIRYRNASRISVR